MENTIKPQWPAPDQAVDHRISLKNECKNHNWGCPYHACMTDQCQMKEVLSNGVVFSEVECNPSNQI